MEFHRLDQGAKIARGLGLGLSIVERLARVLDCTIGLESEAGRGSRFMVTVPLSNAAPVDLPAREDTRIDPGQLVGITALCIDNEPSVLDGMETLLRGWNCAVVKAPDLETALAAVAESPLDSEWTVGRLPSRPWEWRRGHRGAPAPLRRSTGNSDHRRPLAEGA